MKGIEFLRGIYIASGLIIRPKTLLNKLDAFKEIIRAGDSTPTKSSQEKHYHNPTQPSSTGRNLSKFN
jgi:hypothetical protein